MYTFRNKVALITGGSRGVGLATARALVAQGAKVTITARGEERLLKSHAELTALGGEVASVAGDVGDWDDAQRMVRAALDNFGRLDILINNAGVSMRGELADLAPEVIEQVVRTNLLGSIFPTRAALAQLLESRGHAVFISSIAGLLGVPGASVYCATKAALTTFVESLRLECPPARLHTGVVYLGFTEHDPEKRILAADGRRVPPDRPAHHTQDYAAKLILRMIAGRRRSLVMTPIGNLGAWVHRLAPGAVERAIRFAKEKNLGIYQKFS